MMDLTIKLSRDLLRGDRKLAVSSVVTFLPHQFRVLLNQRLRVRVRPVNGTSLVSGHNTGTCCTGARHGKLGANGTLASLGVVISLAEPDNVRYPILVAVTSKEDVVVNVVVVQLFQSAIAVGDMSLGLSVTRLVEGDKLTYAPVVSS